MADTARITQSVVEVLTLQPGVARITQSVVETLVGLGISCASLPHGMGGQFYTYTFPVGSGDPPYTFSITAGVLPPGLSRKAGDSSHLAAERLARKTKNEFE